MLANATIQAKDAAIEYLKMSNYQLKSLADSSQAKDEEDLVPGIISIKKIEGNGFSVNAPEILRQLKRFPKNKLF